MNSRMKLELAKILRDRIYALGTKEDLDSFQEQAGAEICWRVKRNFLDSSNGLIESFALIYYDGSSVKRNNKKIFVSIPHVPILGRTHHVEDKSFLTKVPKNGRHIGTSMIGPGVRISKETAIQALVLGYIP
ncbi:hypothetical protein EBZ39_09040 [bacterium]|nr:hypothetical protein [bacterium]